MAPTHLRKLVVFFAIAAAGWCALLLPTIQRVWDLDAPSALVASPTQALVMIPTKRIGWQGVVDGQIYAMAGGVLCRWTGRAFEPLPRSEAGAVRARMTCCYTAPEGWTARPLPLNGNPIEIAFTIKGAAFQLRGRREDGVKELVLVDQSGRSRTLLSLDTKPRFVSRDSYDRDFRGPRTR